jgi:hypothetical protein
MCYLVCTATGRSFARLASMMSCNSRSICGSSFLVFFFDIETPIFSFLQSIQPKQHRKRRPGLDAHQPPGRITLQELAGVKAQVLGDPGFAGRLGSIRVADIV